MSTVPVSLHSVLTRIALLLLFAGQLTGFGVKAVAADCDFSSARITVGEGEIHYDRAGIGYPVILLHGLFAQKEQWRGLLCNLASAGFDAIAPDLPGFGQSGHYDMSVYDLDRQVDLLDQLTDALGIEEFDLAGNSLGGAIAALYTERHPERVRRLAFIGPPLGLEPWGPRVKQAIIQGVNPFIPMDIAQFDLEMALLFAQPPEVSDETRDSLIRNYVTRNHHYQQVWSIINLFDTVLLDYHGKQLGIEVPVLIIWGESDAIYPVVGAESLHKRLPDSLLVTLPETGHLPMLERTSETGELLIRFLIEPADGQLLPDQ
jgi:pimeloyl-ACP methyl ester carboxylesterase